MTVEALTQYLKRAAELEASVYRQEEARKTAREALVKKNVVKKTLNISQPKAQHIRKPIEPPDYVTDLWFWKFVIGFCVLGAAFMLWVFSTYGMGEEAGIPILVVIGCVLGIVIGVLRHKSISKTKVEERAQYEIKVREYEERSVQAKWEFEEATTRYNQMKAEKEKQNQESYEEECRLAERNFQAASEAVAQLDAPLEETKRLLETLYATDVIFPKYRNLVAMCTIYEYFAAGRCDELTGPAGAYNLYESELRQNLIVNRLETIVDQLDQIKANQYMLYTQLENNNRILHGISGDVKGILRSTQEIACAANITAMCATITAENSEIQKYLTVMSM